MKALKIIGIVFSVVLFGAGASAIGLTVWANLPRGVKIDLSKMN